MEIYNDVVIIDSSFIMPPPEKSRPTVILIQAMDAKIFNDMLRQRGAEIINRIIKRGQ